jgi:hypothetical protein
MAACGLASGVRLSNAEAFREPAATYSTLAAPQVSLSNQKEVPPAAQVVLDPHPPIHVAATPAASRGSVAGRAGLGAPVSGPG